MDRSYLGPLWIIALAAICAGLYYFRGALTPWAMAIILWFAIDSLAHALEDRLRFVPRWLGLLIANGFVLGLVIMAGVLIAGDIGQISAHAGGYEARLNAQIGQLYNSFGVKTPPPPIRVLLMQINPAILAPMLAGVQTFAANGVLILIYVVFLFAVAGSVPGKLDAVFPKPLGRERARQIITAISRAMKTYLLVQTVASLIASVLTYFVLSYIGLDNAPVLAVLIFFLNFVPAIGPIIAVVLPTAFALLQFSSLAQVLETAGGVAIWPFLIGNFVVPRIAGQTLNLSVVAVLMALAVWGTIWGVVGVFLAIPLTVMLAIILAQFSTTRWIAVLLSADAHPEQF